MPQNLGGAIRTAACFGVPLDIVEPCGFPLTDKAIRRAAMDYEARAEVRRHAGWDAFVADVRAGPGRLALLTTSGDVSLGDFRFAAADVLLLGRESAGAPAPVRAAADVTLRIPLAEGARSLNVVVAAGIALWEARRQGALAGRPAGGSSHPA